jgi:hypothetical protein
MAGAKQLVTLGFILVPAGGRTSSRSVLGALYCVAPWCLQRGLQARRERRRSGLQVPEVLIEASANIVVKMESVQVCVVRRPPAAWGLPLLYRPRRRQFTSVPHYFIYM